MSTKSTPRLFSVVSWLAFVMLLVFGLGAGCLCVDSTKEDPLRKCIDTCGTNQYLCQEKCGSDDPCARSCVDAYKMCIGICDKTR